MEWVTIQQFPNYEINTLGQVRNKKSNKILSQSLSSKGYYQINIDNKSRRTHRLLAETFIENPNNLETVNHIDGIKLNNDLSNLEWISRSENVKHSREVLGLIPIPYSKCNKSHHFKDKYGEKSNAGIKIKAIFKNESFKIFGSSEDAARELFGDCKYGRCIRQSIRRGSKFYKDIKFESYE